MERYLADFLWVKTEVEEISGVAGEDGAGGGEASRWAALGGQMNILNEQFWFSALEKY
jgi:hypothetical protein